MASWALTQAQWSQLSRARLRLETLPWSARHLPSSLRLPVYPKKFFSTPLPTEETPAVIALKKQPYPSSGLDTSLFEDVTEDYGYSPDQLGASSSTAARTPCHVLLQLVDDAQYVDADKVRKELQDMGVIIEPSAVYGKAALQALRMSYTNKDERLSAFLSWWDLVPEASNDSGNLPSQMGRTVASSPIPDPTFMIQFSLALAAKGYAPRIWMIVLPEIVRYAPPDSSADFLRAFISADLHYRNNAAPQSIQYAHKRYFRSWYNIVIKTQAMIGRPEAALETLREAHSSGYQLAQSVYPVLLGAARFTGNENLVKAIEELKVSKNINRIEASSIASPLASTQDQIPLSPELRPIFNELQSAFTQGNIPPIESIVGFFEACHSSNNLTTLRELQLAVHRTFNSTAIQIWALAEMLYYWRRRQRQAVLVTFKHYFHAVGIPRIFDERLVNPSYGERLLARREEGGGRKVGAIYQVQRIVSPHIPIHSLLWPSKEHTGLVWDVIVRQTANSESVERLYQDLLSQMKLARQSTNQLGSSSLPTESSPVPTIPAPAQFDTMHFTAFISAFVRRRKHRRAALIISDMLAFGITPSVHALTTLITGMSRAGDVQGVMTLLDNMETTMEPSSRSNKPSLLPAPNETTYTVAIQGLVGSGHYDAAADVAKRLATTLGYVSGANSITDAALIELQKYYPEAMVNGELIERKDAESSFEPQQILSL